MYKARKAVTLLECIAYIGLLAILSLILVKNIINTDNFYMKTRKIYSDKNDIDNLFMNIERFMDEEDVKSIDVENNMLIIYKGNSEKIFEKQEIFKKGNKILIKHYDIRNFEDYNTYNTLDLEVDDFKVKVKKKLIYLIIEKGGRKYIKCL